jgi:hypothetical protein
MEYEKIAVKQWRVHVVRDNRVLAICFRGGRQKWFAVTNTDPYHRIGSKFGTLKEIFEISIKYLDLVESRKRS